MKPNLKLFLTVGIAALFSTFAFADSITIPIKVIAFGGKVTIVGIVGNPITPKKGVELGAGSVISTGPNSWIDLAQGGLSTIRIMAKTKSFTVTSSSFDQVSKKVNSLFRLKGGQVYVRVNHKALPQGSKYQVQMPELIAGVVGSDAFLEDDIAGDQCYCVAGTVTATDLKGKIDNVPPGQYMLVRQGGVMGLAPVGKTTLAALKECGVTVSTPSGDAVNGVCTGGTAAGIMPDNTAIYVTVSVDASGAKIVTPNTGTTTSEPGGSANPASPSSP